MLLHAFRDTLQERLAARDEAILSGGLGSAATDGYGSPLSVVLEIKFPMASAYSLVYAALSNGFARRRPPDARCRLSLVEATAPELLTPVCLDQSSAKDSGSLRVCKSLTGNIRGDA